MALRHTLHRAITPIKVYSILGLMGCAVVFHDFFVLNGELIDNYFFHDTMDTGMDFFHSIEYVKGRAPYFYFSTLYPPLANLLFYICFHMIPPSVTSMWSMDFLESVNNRGTSLDLRLYQSPMLLFCLFLVISTWLFVSLMLYIMHDCEQVWRNCAVLCMLISPGVTYAIERGNILLLSIPLCLFFIAFRNSKSWIIRELALLSLAVAAGLKLYPAFFGVLLLYDKKFFSAARTIFYGIMSIVLPALFFREGLSGIPMWLDVVFSFENTGSMPWTGTGFSSILHHVALYVKQVFTIDISTQYFSLIAICLSMLLLTVAVFLDKEWQRVLAVVMAIIMFQSQGKYIFSFLVIPMVFFLKEEAHFSIKTVIPFYLMTGMLVNLPLYYVRTESYPDVVMSHWLCALLTIWCFVVFTEQMIKKLFLRYGGKGIENLE